MNRDPQEKGNNPVLPAPLVVEEHPVRPAALVKIVQSNAKIGENAGM
jgi:hypothetical protein